VFDSGIPRVRYSITIGAEEVTVRLEQSGEIYDLPVTVTLHQTDGKVREEVVLLTEAATEARLPIKGAIRSVEVNADHGALAHFERVRGGSDH
jgi:hypothetical protein